jgi:hypothetical protein
LVEICCFRLRKEHGVKGFGSGGRGVFGLERDGVTGSGEQHTVRGFVGCALKKYSGNQIEKN